MDNHGIRTIMGKVFQILCGCLASIGKLLGWDYYKASVYVCIHLWPWLCVVMALVLLIKAAILANPLWIIVCAIYVLFNVFGYWAVIKHYYPGTIEEIFEHCYFDLMALAQEWHTSYAIVNLIIYIVLFVSITAFDVSIFLLI